MSSISNSSISIESEALAAPVIHTGFHRENPRLTVNDESEDEFSNNSGASRKNIYTRLRSLVVRTSDFSMNKRVLKGISHTRVSFSGYFDETLGDVAQPARAYDFLIIVSRVEIPPSPLREGTRIGISACLRASGDPVNSRFGSRGVSSTPLSH